MNIFVSPECFLFFWNHWITVILSRVGSGHTVMLVYTSEQLRSLNHDRPPHRNIRKVLFAYRLWWPKSSRRNVRRIFISRDTRPDETIIRDVNNKQKRSSMHRIGNDSSLTVGWLNVCSLRANHRLFTRPLRINSWMSAFSRRPGIIRRMTSVCVDPLHRDTLLLTRCASLIRPTEESSFSIGARFRVRN